MSEVIKDASEHGGHDAVEGAVLGLEELKSDPEAEKTRAEMSGLDELVIIAATETVDNAERSDSASEKLALPEAIGERIDKAYETSSFKLSPEVQEAIKGCYEDHYLLGSVIEKVILGKAEGITKDSIDGLIDNYFLRETAKSLLDQPSRGDALLAAQEVIFSSLFKESAIAEETVSDDETKYALGLVDILRQQAVDEGVADAYSQEDASNKYYWREGVGNFPSNVSRQLRDPSELNVGGEYSVKEVWEDTRHAGQLEFHNTGQFGKISRDGFVLRSRTRQKELNGDFYSQMGTVHTREGGNMHSNLPHFSEIYDYFGYKQPVPGYGNSVESDSLTPATAAIPLAEIISVAPYARDAKYGIVELKDPSDQDKVTVKDGIGIIGSQGTDMSGTHGEDRVFMADYRADKASEAVNYDLDFGHTGMVLMTETEKSNGQTFGHGQGYAGEVIVPDIAVPDYAKTRGEHAEMSEAVFSEFYKGLLEDGRKRQSEAIVALQKESRESKKYAGKIIAPLRRGVLEFIPEASSSSDNGYRLKKVALHSVA